MNKKEFYEHLQKYLSDEEIEKLIDSFSTPRNNGLLLNKEKLSEEKLLNTFKGLKKHTLIKNGYFYDPNEISPAKHFLYDAGCYYLQDISAMYVSSSLDFSEDDIVLDLCAAPGGKTIQASLKMNNKGLIIANDVSTKRANILISNIERMGRGNIIVTNEDALNLCKKLPSIFTKIILDAPCSGSGMFKKDEKMIDDWSLKKVQNCAIFQKELINAAFSLLVPGGTLLYSTCSFSYEENEEVIFSLEKSFDVERINLPSDKSFYRSKNLKEAIHLFPSYFDGDGHFICQLKKPGEFKKSELKKDKAFKYNELSTLYEYEQNGITYGLTYPYFPKNIRILRLGVKQNELKGKTLVPHHHYARFLPSTNSLPLTYEELEKYLKGLTLKRDNLANGYYIVKYENLNFGYVKNVNGTLKNLYPKGLRH